MKRNFDFIKTRKICVIVSLCILALGLLFNLIFGTKLDVEFSGGTLIRYSYEGTVDQAAVQEVARRVLGNEATVTLENVDNTDVASVSLAKEITLETQTELNKAVTEAFPGSKQFSANTLSATMGHLFFIKCIVAVVLAAALLLVYVGLRFRKIGGLSAGAFALLALLHDLLICYFVFVVFRIELNDNFVAVLLTILGYSLNDTIVIFDRVRENRRRNKTMPISEVVNLSVNQSFTRTLITTIAVFIAIATVVVVGLVMRIDSILSFALPMLFGVVSGFYSSVFLASPLWAWWRENHAEKAKKKA